MKKLSITIAALMIALLMLCGCSGDEIDDIEVTNVGTDISRYADDESEETISEIMAETVLEAAETAEEASDTESYSDETATLETTAETTFASEEITSADIPDISEETASETEKAVQKYYFRSEKLFDSHYEKHGAEFGDITQDEYLDLANELINAEGDNILHKTEKEDGDFLYYDTETNEFLVLSTDGYIRTFFKPSAGLDYWERQ